MAGSGVQLMDLLLLPVFQSLLIVTSIVIIHHLLNNVCRRKRLNSSKIKSANKYLFVSTLNEATV